MTSRDNAEYHLDLSFTEEGGGAVSTGTVGQGGGCGRVLSN